MIAEFDLLKIHSVVIRVAGGQPTFAPPPPPAQVFYSSLQPRAHISTLRSCREREPLK